MPKYNGPIRKPKAALGDGEKATAASAAIATIEPIFRMVRHPKIAPSTVGKGQRAQGGDGSTGSRPGARSPCRLSPKRSSGTSTKANAVTAAEISTSGRILWSNMWVKRKEPTLSAADDARLMIDISTAKAKPSARGGQ